MADQPKKDYATVVGFVAFEPDTIENKSGNGHRRKLVCFAAGSQKRVDATLFDNWDDVEINQGDFIAMRGPFQVNTSTVNGAPRTYNNLTVYELAVNGVPQVARERDQAPVNANDDADADDAPF